MDCYNRILVKVPTTGIMRHISILLEELTEFSLLACWKSLRIPCTTSQKKLSGLLCPLELTFLKIEELQFVNSNRFCNMFENLLRQKMKEYLRRVKSWGFLITRVELQSIQHFTGDVSGSSGLFIRDNSLATAPIPDLSLSRPKIKRTKPFNKQSKEFFQMLMRVMENFIKT